MAPTSMTRAASRASFEAVFVGQGLKEGMTILAQSSWNFCGRSAVWVRYPDFERAVTGRALGEAYQPVVLVNLSVRTCDLRNVVDVSYAWRWERARDGRGRRNFGS